MKRFNVNHAKQIDLVEYFKSIGHELQKIRCNDYWHDNGTGKEDTNVKIYKTRNPFVKMSFLISL